MNAGPNWGAYVKRTHSQYVGHYLDYAQAHNRTSKLDFNTLLAEWPAISTAMERAYEVKHWAEVLSFMSATEHYLHLQGRWREAEALVKCALEAAQQLSDGGAQTHWLFFTGLMQDEQGQYELAEKYYRQCLEGSGDPATHAEARRRLGWLDHIRGKAREAQESYRAAVALHRQIGDRQGEARDLRQLGLLALDQGDFAQADENLQMALDRANSDEGWEARRLQMHVWLDLGHMALGRGHLDEARRHLTDALKPAASGEDRLLLADIHFYLGMLAELENNLPEADREYQERLKFSRETGDRQGEASALIAQGTVALQQLRYDDAQGFYEKALAVGEPRNGAVARAQMGTLAYLQKNYAQAESHLQAALDTFQEFNHLQEAAGCQQQLGLVAQAVRRWHAADEHYLASLKIRLELGLLHEACESYYQLGTLAQQQGQREVAKDYYRNALAAGKDAAPQKLEMVRKALEALT